jgi:hypothetical protein
MQLVCVWVFYMWGGIAHSVERLATGWTVREWNPGGGQDFTNLSRPALVLILYNVYRVYFRRVKRTGRGVKYLFPSSAEVKERVEQYLYSPSGFFTACFRVTFTFTYFTCVRSPAEK